MKKTVQYYFGLLLIFIILFPVLIVVLTSVNSGSFINIDFKELSLKWYIKLFFDKKWMQSFFNSIIIALSSSILSVFFGFCLIFLKMKNRIISLLVIFFIVLPIIIPSLIFGVSFLFFFSNIGLVDTYTGIIIAHAMLSFPISYFVIKNGINNMDFNLIIITKINNASMPFMISEVVLPYIKMYIIIAYLFAFLISFDEPVIALFLTNSNVRTLPRQIFDGLRYDLDPTVSAVSTISILISMAIILFIAKYNIKNKMFFKGIKINKI
jgi:putative spermidine/putrescine transport system permease protein